MPPLKEYLQVLNRIGLMTPQEHTLLWLVFVGVLSVLVWLSLVVLAMQVRLVG